MPTAFRQSKRQTLLDPQTERKQLSFSLGIVGAPDRASLKISGKMPVARDLRYHERVHVRVTDMDGNVLTSYEGNVDDVRFPTKRDEFGDVASITREHTVTLG